MTKKDWYLVLDNIVEDSDFADKAGAHDFIQHEINLLNKRNKPKKEEDTLKDIVYQTLTADFRCIDDIYADIISSNPPLKPTTGQIANRLARLVNEGLVERSYGHIRGCKMMVYRLVDKEGE